jgi:hypothetical protein
MVDGNVGFGECSTKFIKLWHHWLVKLKVHLNDHRIINNKIMP